jgi:hypothetical protein
LGEGFDDCGGGFCRQFVITLSSAGKKGGFSLVFYFTAITAISTISPISAILAILLKFLTKILDNLMENSYN